MSNPLIHRTRMSCLPTRRKIKCDEQKPNCSQCNRRQIACEYQPPKLRWKHGFAGPRVHRSFDSSPIGASSFNNASHLEPAMPAADQVMSMDSFISTCDLSDSWSFPSQDSVSWPDFDQTWTSLDGSMLPGLSILGSECSYADASLPFSPSSNSFHPSFVWQAPWASVPGTLHSAVEAPLNQKLAIPSRMLSDTTTTFISYYFHYVGPMLCCYQHIDNPFITAVSQEWNMWNAESLPYVLHSLSLACLAGSTPRLEPLACELRGKAKRILVQEIDSSRGAASERSAELSLILLGVSASWAQPHDSMLDFFERFETISSHKSASTQWDPFQEGIKTYWQMYLTFMSSPEPHRPCLARSASHAMLMSQINSAPVKNAHPHPWTGMSAEIISLLTQVGQLIRHHEATCAQPPSSFCNASAHEAAAELLESKLLQHCKVSAQDSVQLICRTETALLHLSELYQTAALLQLYRIFPALTTKPGRQAYETQLGLKLFQESCTDQILLAMAFHILRVALETDLTSQTLRFQLVPVVLACSELRLHGLDKDDLGTSQPLSLLMHQTCILQIAEARRLAKNHLTVMERVFPGKRMCRVANIISAMWDELDRTKTDEELHWIGWLSKNIHDVL